MRRTILSPYQILSSSATDNYDQWYNIWTSNRRVLASTPDEEHSEVFLFFRVFPSRHRKTTPGYPSQSSVNPLIDDTPSELEVYMEHDGRLKNRGRACSLHLSALIIDKSWFGAKVLNAGKLKTHLLPDRQPGDWKFYIFAFSASRPLKTENWTFMLFSRLPYVGVFRANFQNFRHPNMLYRGFA